MRVKLTIALCTLIGIVMFGACRKQASKPQNANSNAASTQQEAPVGGEATAGEKFYFRGTIANNLQIEMTLVRDGDRLTGTYSYPKVGKSIALNGTIDKDGNVEIKESDESGKDTGVFKGKWKPATDVPDIGLSEIEGKWSKPDRSKEATFLISQQPIEFSSTARLATKVIKETNKQAHYSIDAEFPQIEGDTRFDKFNKEARGMVTKEVAEWKTGETAGSDASAPALEDQNSDLGIGFDFRLATDDLISVEFGEDAFSRGAAHPNNFTTVLNYDVKNGKKLTLADLFNPKSNYLSVVSSYCINDLKQQSKKNKDSMIDADMMRSGASARADNYKAWAITKKGLWITFDPYQVAPYAAGPQHVLVPYSALKDVIKPDGPVAALAK